MLYYTMTPDVDGAEQVVVIGVLHESMEARRRLNKALRGVDEDPTNT